MADLELFLDLGCPWSYLALNRAREAAMRTGSALNIRPVCALDVLEEVDPEGAGRKHAELAPRLAWRNADLQAWAGYCGVTIQQSDGQSARLSDALAAAALIEDAKALRAFCEEVFVAYFGRGEDLTETDRIAGCADSAGLDGASLTNPESISRGALIVAQNAAELIRRGGFGTPTAFVGDELYFGNDRMPLVELALGQASDIQFTLPGDHGGGSMSA